MLPEVRAAAAAACRHRYAVHSRAAGSRWRQPLPAQAPASHAEVVAAGEACHRRSHEAQAAEKRAAMQEEPVCGCSATPHCTEPLPPQLPSAAARRWRYSARHPAPYGAAQLARQALQVLPRGRHRGLSTAQLFELHGAVLKATWRCLQPPLQRCDRQQARMEPRSL